VFSRRFVKSFPSLSSGFEIETELTVHALELRMPVAEVETQYGTRPEGSESKLSTFTDGFRILKMIAILIKEERPLQFFSGLFGLFVVTSIILAIPVVSTYLETGLVPRFPTAILATGMMLLGFLCLACGLILDTVTRGRQELKRLQYLNVNRSG
ncbi:MAG: glycosyl transferase, partial [Gammaproteobacteria bacterium]|nr:glycosyl transferase [Gammaproteobacteria bacterium]